MLVTHNWPFTLPVKNQTLFRAVSKRFRKLCDKCRKMDMTKRGKQQRCESEELKGKSAHKTHIRTDVTASHYKKCRKKKLLVVQKN